MGTKHTTDEHSAAASLATSGGKLLFFFLAHQVKTLVEPAKLCFDLLKAIN